MPWNIVFIKYVKQIELRKILIISVISGELMRNCFLKIDMDSDVFIVSRKFIEKKGDS